MELSDVIATLMFLGVVAYAVFGGADFGTGLWDLTAGTDEQGSALRSQIDRSLGPVWEANHVWLIYVFVFLWTAFPPAFVAIMNTLFVPWMLVALGIVLRGGAFAFRKFSTSYREAQLHGIVFAASSIITPFFLGMIAGAIASGRVPLDSSGDIWTSWTGPTSWVGGILAVLTCSFLAGTFLAADAARSGHDEIAARVGRRSARGRSRHRRGRDHRGRHARARRRVARQRTARTWAPAHHHLRGRRAGSACSDSSNAGGIGPASVR